MEPSTISVPPELAEAFNAASPEEREKALFRMSLSLCSSKRKPLSTDEFLDRMHELGRKAQERGLPPDILEETCDSQDSSRS